MIAKELNGLGIILQEKNFALAKKVLKKDEKIQKHNHPTANILFTVVKGEILVSINEDEKHLLTSGSVLNFDGDNFISAIAKDDTEVLVTLINK
ncbi:hypothetical protein HMPREF3188_00888 [Tissierellia bacterium KA00581]|nr:hypothetical protein HMPREF3188_00888 [Tissierellia bacterium KA00581]